jgi:hypothetical protein
MLRIIIVKARALQKLRTPDTAEQNPLRSELTNHAPANHRTASGASESPCWNPSRAQVILIVFKTRTCTAPYSTSSSLQALLRVLLYGGVT